MVKRNKLSYYVTINLFINVTETGNFVTLTLKATAI